MPKFDGALHSRRCGIRIDGVVDKVYDVARDKEGRRALEVFLQGAVDKELEESTGVPPNGIHVTMHDRWCDALGFLVVGDEVTVDGFDIMTTESLHEPFGVLVTDLSEVRVRRVRDIVVNAKNVATFNFKHDTTSPRQKSEALKVVEGHNQFLRMGKYYDVVYGSSARFKHETSFLLQLLTERTKSNVLDVACGSGLISFFMRYYDLAVTGVDASKTLIDIAQDKLKFQLETEPSRKPPCRFLVADMRGFEVLKPVREGEDPPAEEEGAWGGTEQFDSALCINALHLLPSLACVQMTLRRIWYHLELNGCFICDIPNVHTIPLGHSQQHVTYPIARDAVAVTAAKLDEGVLDVTIRTHPVKDKKRTVEYSGSALQKNSMREQYFTTFDEAVVELVINPADFENMLREEMYEVDAMYGDMEGSAYDPHASERRVYVCRRKDLNREKY
eukprot:TRINITY_DN22079_c0_g1_i1.p1 TRINITY_DN22079_c0_g1~~TRINITY_DN22079_c0_g1_i1.p1  ORF type:complete len:446 (+),score=201.83 TRINITY_DN22079_c0_g1_i1:59-1396(+)